MADRGGGHDDADEVEEDGAEEESQEGGPTGDDDEGPQRHEGGDTRKRAALSRQESEVASEQGGESGVPAEEKMEDGIGEKTSGGAATGEPDEPARDAGETGARGAYILPAELEDLLKSLAAGEASKATPRRPDDDEEWGESTAAGEPDDTAPGRHPSLFARLTDAAIDDDDEDSGESTNHYQYQYLKSLVAGEASEAIPRRPAGLLEGVFDTKDDDEVDEEGSDGEAEVAERGEKRGVESPSGAGGKKKTRKMYKRMRRRAELRQIGADELARGATAEEASEMTGNKAD